MLASALLHVVAKNNVVVVYEVHTLRERVLVCEYPHLSSLHRAGAWDRYPYRPLPKQRDPGP
jgi:hypothetical protein